MTLFMFIGFDHAPHSMALRDKLRSEHRRYVFENDQMLTLVGIMEDEAGNQCGTTYVFDVESEQDVWRWLEAEPFWMAGVYVSGRVVSWNLPMNRHPGKEWGALKPGGGA